MEIDVAPALTTTSLPVAPLPPEPPTVPPSVTDGPAEAEALRLIDDPPTPPPPPID